MVDIPDLHSRRVVGGSGIEGMDISGISGTDTDTGCDSGSSATVLEAAVKALNIESASISLSASDRLRSVLSYLCYAHFRIYAMYTSYLYYVYFRIYDMYTFVFMLCILPYLCYVYFRIYVMYAYLYSPHSVPTLLELSNYSVLTHC